MAEKTILEREEKPIVWTNSQEDALAAQRENLLISAAAGSGKTAVLTERIFRLLTDENDPIAFSEIIAITFTRAAAASLRAKLSARLERAVAEEPKNELYRRLLLELPHAAISTVHSFCLRIIRENAASLGLPSRLALISDAEKDRLQKECMQEAMNHVFQTAAPLSQSAKSCLSTVYYLILQGEQSDPTDLPLRLYDRLMALEEGVGKLTDLNRRAQGELAAWERENLDFFDTAVGALAGRQFSTRLQTLLGRIPAYFSFFPANERENEGILPSAHELQRQMQTLAHLLENGGFEACSRFVCSLTLSRYANKSQTIPPSCDQGKFLRDFFNQRIKKPFLALCEELSVSNRQLLEAEQERVQVQTVFETLLLDFQKRYSAKKRGAGLLDYSDLEHYALKVFRPEGTQQAPAYTCRALFVDEYQDTNPLQDTLFRACVKNGGFFFFVGDVKQSIYRFRHAAPELFLNYKNNFPDIHAKSASRLSEDALGKSICFAENFRSDSTVIDFANRVFSLLMNDNENKKDRMYSKRERLNKRKTTDRFEPVELYLVNKKTAPTKKGEIDLIVERVLRLLHEEGRRPEEIAVIAYANSFLSKLRKAFSKAGIPVSQSNSDLMEALEVQCLISVLKVLDNPLSDVALAGLCTGRLFSFSSAELEEVRSYSQGALYDALLTAANDASLSPIAERAEEVCDWIKHWRAIAARTCVHDFLLQLLRRGGVLSALSVGEEKRRENLLKIYREAQAFEANERHTLTDFLRYLNSRQAQRFQTESDGEIREGAVTLMTVHKSKGLEFPVCIFAQLAKEAKKSGEMLFHPEFGLYHHLYDAKLHSFYPTLSEQSVRRTENEAAREEAKRVLYVGITRAREKLILISGTPADVTSRFEKSGVYPYHDKHSIHSRELNAPIHLLLYSLRGDRKLQRVAKNCANGKIPTGPVCCEDFTLHIVDPEELITPEEACEQIFSAPVAPSAPTQADFQAIRDALCAWEGREARELLPTKLSVSEILHMKTEENRQQKTKLSFAKEELLGAAHGTAMHAFMQFCDFAAARRSVEEEAARLCSLAFLSQEQTENLNFFALSRFFGSKTFAELEKSPHVKRELRFNVFLPASEVLETAQAGDVLIQGVIDCFYEKEDGTYAILDFKTDSVNPKTGANELLARHSRQLRIYARALEELTGKRVSSLAIYSFALARALDVSLSE